MSNTRHLQTTHHHQQRHGDEQDHPPGRGHGQPAGVHRRFVDPEQLICPGCAEQVRPEPPAYWRVAWGLPAPQFSHPDASPLCADASGRPCEPVETPTPTPTAQAR